MNCFGLKLCTHLSSLLNFSVGILPYLYPNLYYSDKHTIYIQITLFTAACCFGIYSNCHKRQLSHMHLPSKSWSHVLATYLHTYNSSYFLPSYFSRFAVRFYSVKCKLSSPVILFLCYLLFFSFFHGLLSIYSRILYKEKSKTWLRFLVWILVGWK